MMTTPQLTPRQAEVLELITDGESGKEIGHRLGISPRTVEVYRAQLLRMFEVRSVTKLISQCAEARGRAGFGYLGPVAQI